MAKDNKKLLISSFLAQFTLSFVSLSLVFYLTYRNLQPRSVGIASALPALFYFLSCLCYQKIYQKWNGHQKTKIVISLLGMMVCLFSAILSPNEMLLFVFLSFYGIFQGLLWTNVEDMLSEGKENSELARTLSHFNVAWCLGAAISSILSGVISDRSPIMSLYLSLPLFLITSIVVISSKSLSDNRVSAGDYHGILEEPTSLRYFCWILLFFVYLSFSLITVVFPIYLSEELGFSDTLIGTLLLFRGLSSVLSFVLFSRFQFYKRNPFSILLSALVLMAILSFMGINQSPIFYAVLLFFYGIVFSLSYVSSIYNSTTGAKNRVKMLTIHECSLTLGTVLGSSLCAIIYEKYGFRSITEALMIMLVAFLIVSIPIMYRLGAFRRTKEA